MSVCVHNLDSAFCTACRRTPGGTIRVTVTAHEITGLQGGRCVVQHVKVENETGTWHETFAGEESQRAFMQGLHCGIAMCGGRHPETRPGYTQRGPALVPREEK